MARLLAHGADPSLRDEQGRTPLDLCRRGRAGTGDQAPFDEVEAILAPLTSAAPPSPRARRREPNTRRRGPA